MYRLYKFFVNLFSKNKTMIPKQEVIDIISHIKHIQKLLIEAQKKSNDMLLPILYDTLNNTLNLPIQQLEQIKNQQERIIQEQKSAQKMKRTKGFGDFEK